MKLLSNCAAPVLLVGWLACEGRAADPPAAPPTFRVMTYNIHHAEGLDGKVDLQRIADLIRQEGADIVALQEVDQGTERTARRDMPAELAKLTGLSCVFSNNYSFQGGQYGNAVLTRFPIVTVTNLHYRVVRAGEQRGLLQVTLQVHGRELIFMGTHIDHRPDDTERVASVAEILTVRTNYAGKTVMLCGDFNDKPGSRMQTRLKEVFADTWEKIGAGDGFTIPAESPRSRIDYIWFTPQGALEPVRSWIPKSQASDHLPVVAEFRFR